MKQISISTSSRTQFVDITGDVQRTLKEFGAGDGSCVVYVPHTTAAITINENADPSVVRDILEKLSELVPHSSKYHHTEGNSDAHIKSVLVGQSVTVPVKNGRLMLGTWQGIFLCEFDGPRNRRVVVNFTGTSR